MCGPQIGLVIGNEHDLQYYSKIYNLILTRIEIIVDNYNYINIIESIEIMYSVIIPQKELTLKNISNYSLNQPLINKKEVKRNFNQNLLPLSLDTSYYGFNLFLEERQKYIKLINSNLMLNIIEKIFIINDLDKIFIYTSIKKKNYHSIKKIK